MSEDRDRGLLASAVEVSKNLLTVLPPAFIVLCGINVVFLWIVMKFIQHESDTRLAVLNKIVEHCLAR